MQGEGADDKGTFISERAFIGIMAIAAIGDRKTVSEGKYTMCELWFGKG